MSYVVGVDGRIKERVHFAALAPMGRVRGRRKRSGRSLGGGIFGGLGVIGGGPQIAFEEAIEAASDALTDLAERALTVQRTTFSVQQKEVARQVAHFAMEPGARKLQRAAEQRSLPLLEDLQRVTESMMNISLSEGIVSDLVNRFVRATILPPSVLSAEDVDKINEIVRQPLPGFPPPGKVPWFVYAGAAAGGVFAVGYLIHAIANLTD